MKDFIKGFIYEEDGMGVIEIVIIIAVLVSVALVFRDSIFAFTQDLMKNVFNQDNMQNSSEVEGGSVY